MADRNEYSFINSEASCLIEMPEAMTLKIFL